MDELTSKQAAIDAINSHFGFNIEDEYGSAVQEVINGLPSAQPERKTGRWEKVYGDHICAGHRPWTICCSECGMIGGGTRYCPNCGAYMGGGDNSETD